jgi:predicted RNase H-like nuclease
MRLMKREMAAIGIGREAGSPGATTVVRGVDGCKNGWIAVTVSAVGPLRPEVAVAARFADLTQGPAVIAVDMPIGLPERVGTGGRGPESLVRPRLGERQSSVFSVPSRRAVHCEDYGEACRVALETSDPPRKVSKQAFFLFPKIREIDALLRMEPGLRERVFEVHPELAFWRLNGEAPAALPKKVKSSPHAPGLELRRAILARHGFDPAVLAKPPRGAGPDDLIDAAVNALIARRILEGGAQSFPDPPGRDAYGLPVAIWA